MTRSFVFTCLWTLACTPVLAAGIGVAGAEGCPDEVRRAAAATDGTVPPAGTPRPAVAAGERPRADSSLGSNRRARWHSLLPGMHK